MTDHLAPLLLTELRAADANWSTWLKRDGNAVRMERRFLSRLSNALERAESGDAGLNEVAYARRSLQALYRALGMHP